MKKGFNGLVSQSINRAINRDRGGYIWERVLGITLSDLKTHLEKQFDENMNWDNYGDYWVIDKIIPLKPYLSNDEFRKVWSLKNLRPYPRKLRNSRKQGIDWELVEEYHLYDILPIGILGDNLWTNKNL